MEKKKNLNFCHLLLIDPTAYDFSNMKKSLSADVSTVSSGNPSLDAYISTESSLLNFDQTVPRSRTGMCLWQLYFLQDNSLFLKIFKTELYVKNSKQHAKHNLDQSFINFSYPTAHLSP